MGKNCYKSFQGTDENVLKLDYGDDCVAASILKTTELYILKGELDIVFQQSC